MPPASSLVENIMTSPLGGTSNTEADSVNGAPAREALSAPDGKPFGTSQIGVHDLVPELGYREYWYPAIELGKLGKRSHRFFGRVKPMHRKLLGEDVVLFLGKNGKVAALRDRCPHRGAYLSQGRCEFEGTVSCSYHGYTYDDTGTCVAALTEGPNSGLVGKLRVKSYSTEVVRGVVFVWMGQTEPVPIEEDVPEEFFDPQYVVVSYSTVWPMNWTLAVENSGDNHFSYIHRFRFRRILNTTAFQKLAGYWPGVKIIDIEEDRLTFRPAGAAPPQAFYPSLGKNWPQHVWFRVIRARRPAEKNMHRKPYTHEYRLPSIARVHGSAPGRLHMRWGTPIDENNNLQWSFGISKVNNWIQRLYWELNLRTWYRLLVIKTTNELEDVPVQRYDRLDTTAPQKLGANDAPIIIWRRRLPLTSRDNIRVWKKGTKDNLRITQVGHQDVVEEV
jgi:phenylpropionate dioxygenase-like ring-hydroxylating dioxygenase large terminal subunit